jgi:hypothetical protein
MSGLPAFDTHGPNGGWFQFVLPTYTDSGRYSGTQVFNWRLTVVSS